MDLYSSAKNIVDNYLSVKKNEKVLIIVDVGMENIGKALFQAAEEARAESLLVKMIQRKSHGEEPPKPVAEMMKYADAIIAATMFSLTHTKARRFASIAGARIATIPNLSGEIFAKGGISADPGEIEKIVKKTHATIKDGRMIKIKTGLGTEFSMSIEPRTWITDTGACREKGSLANLPAGEIFIAPNEGSANGILVVDGSFGKLLDTPAKIIVKKGIAEKVEDKETEKMLDKMGRNGKHVCEFGFGLNSNAKISGHPVEDEKALGTVHIGFGERVKSGNHIDAVIKNPTVIVNDKTILENGKLVL